MKVFIAGIIQGSHIGRELHNQDYRAKLKQILASHLSQAELLCPLDIHPLGARYTHEQAKAAFLSLIEEAGQADVVVCYLPSASMGTAIEMWQAYQNGKIVLTITPMQHNWVVKFLSTKVFASVQEFEAFVASGGLRHLANPADKRLEGPGGMTCSSKTP